MSTPIPYLTAQERINQLVCEARRRDLRHAAQQSRRRAGVRRLAVIVPGSHFNLVSVPPLPDGSES
jgi:hypothetical protein